MTTNYAGIDYYTATSDNLETGMEWHTIWQKHRAESVKTGHKVSTPRRFGYECMYINGLTWGERTGKSYLMTSSGDVSGLSWSGVLPNARRITRVDFHYTFQSEQTIKLSELYEQWLTTSQGKRKASFITNSDGGETLYVGSRSSEQYGRFYNKSIESKLTLENVYRLEVELKKPRSDVVFEKLYKDVGQCSLNPTDVKNYVLSWFLDRGVATNVNFDAVNPIKLGQIATSDEKKIIWLKTAVAPTIRDLLDRGLGYEVAAALDVTNEQYEQLSLNTIKIEQNKGLTKKRLEKFAAALADNTGA